VVEISLALSGWSPKYVPPRLVRLADTQRVLLGSDFALVTPDRQLKGVSVPA